MDPELKTAPATGQVKEAAADAGAKDSQDCPQFSPTNVGQGTCGRGSASTFGQRADSLAMANN